MQCIGDNNKECLPEIIECEHIVEWNNYLNQLYVNVFKPYFLESYPLFKGKKVVIRKEPMDGSWEHDFVHMTHEDYYHNSKDPNNRIPDLRRLERFQVVLERRKDIYFIITSFYVNKDWELKKRMDKYELYKNRKRH